MEVTFNFADHYHHDHDHSDHDDHHYHHDHCDYDPDNNQMGKWARLGHLSELGGWKS